MENKYYTLLTIYDLVKNDLHPTLIIFHPNEIIVRQNLPWDETVNHLNQLQSESLVQMQQLSTAIISITEKGLQYASMRTAHVA